MQTVGELNRVECRPADPDPEHFDPDPEHFDPDPEHFDPDPEHDPFSY